MNKSKDPNKGETKKRNQFSSFKKRPVQNKKVTKLLDSNLFVKKAEPTEKSEYIATRLIEELPVNPAIISNLLKKGYKTPTEIQDKTLIPLLSGKDLLGLAQTGTGKTGAFLIPLVHNLLNSKAQNQVLVISPTRELALQIDEEFKSISRGLQMSSICLIGGTSVNADVTKLRNPHHFIIGTPGRIADMVRQRALNLSNFSTLVLDEFDRLLDMGFYPEINKMVERMQYRKQTILFSATEDKTQRKLIDNLLNNQVEVRLRKSNVSGDNIDQEIIKVKEGENKIDLLINLIRDESFEKVLVFADTKRWVAKVCKNLKKAGIKVDEIHGDKSQNYRIKVLDSFKNRKIQVLVATDVAARGLDIVDVTHVINYQQPQNMENYIHRIGRTGRAGKKGKAYTFVN